MGNVPSPPSETASTPQATAASRPAAPSIPAVPTIAPLTLAAIPTVPPIDRKPTPTRARQPHDGEFFTPEQISDLENRLGRLDELDYFQILKLEKNASRPEIKSAFYQESRAYHPDRFYHMPDAFLKDRIHGLYKRITEAYYVLRDERKRHQYLADIAGPQRAQKLRFTEASEVETKQAVKKEQELQIGSHPKGRQFFATGMSDYNAERWSGAERNFKMALTYEPQNALYKEKLQDVQQKLYQMSKEQGLAFRIK